MKNRLAVMVLAVVFSAAAFAGETSDTPPATEKTQKPANPVVKIVTTKGEILVELDAEKAPVSVANFLAYTKDGFYNGTIFHRVIKDFMIQGGGMTPDMQQKKTNPPIKNEAANGLKNKRGTIAMARTNIPDSATSQFFINHKDNAFLDFKDPSPRGIGYAVFGKVISGMEVVDAIAVTPTRPGDVPVEPVVIESVTVVEKKDDAKCCGQTCTKDCDKCPKKETCTKQCPKEAVCCKDGKCTQEECPCCVDGKCCGKDCKCCKKENEV